MPCQRSALVEALTGRFDDHHGELARILPGQVGALLGQVGADHPDRDAHRPDRDPDRGDPAAQGVAADGVTGPARRP